MTRIGRAGIDDHRTRIRQLIAEHDAGPLRHVGPLEEAVRLADVAGDVELGIEARTQLLRAAFFTSRPEKAFVAFAWIRSRVSEVDFVAPALIDGHFYVAQAAPLFPAITREQITEVLDEMEVDFERVGFGIEPACMMRLLAALRMGDLEAATREHARWVRARESSWRCGTCVADLEAHLLQMQGRRDEAIARALPTALERSECDGGCNIPVAIAARMLVPLWEAGRDEEAREFVPWILPRLVRHADDPSLPGQVLEYLALAGDLERALPLIDETCGQVGDNSKQWYVFQWSLGLALVAERARVDGHAAFPVRRLPEAIVPAGDGPYRTAEVSSASRSATERIAEQFDARNGNDFHARWIRTSFDRLQSAIDLRS